MIYIILNTFNPDHPMVVTDKNGKTMFFYTEEEAENYSNKLQSGQVVMLDH